VPRCGGAGVRGCASALSRTRGATFVPISSILRSILSCGKVPLLYFKSKRDRPSTRTVFEIFRGHGVRWAHAPAAKKR